MEKTLKIEITGLNNSARAIKDKFKIYTYK